MTASFKPVVKSHNKHSQCTVRVDWLIGKYGVTLHTVDHLTFKHTSVLVTHKSVDWLIIKYGVALAHRRSSTFKYASVLVAICHGGRVMEYIRWCGTTKRGRK